mgnify:CR=1 FL=1
MAKNPILSPYITRITAVNDNVISVERSYEEILAKREKIGIYRGSIDNVAKRIYLAAKKYNLDHIVRITGDDILRDDAMIDKAVLSHLKSSCDVTITKNMPYGTSTEIMSIDTLKKVG